MLPRLELRHLAMLVGVAEAPSMSHAAELLGLTQSALSHRLREAERRLGTALFRRERKGLALTPAGERLLLTARRLLADLARTESDVAQIAAAGITDVARVGQAFYAALPWYPAFHAQAARVLPTLQIELLSDTAERPLELLAEGALDLAITVGGLWRPGVVLRTLFTDALVAVTAPEHPWARLPYVTPLDLSREVFLSSGFTVVPGFEHQRFMTPAGLYPRRVIKVGRPEAALELTAAGQGVCIRARWATRSWEAAGRVVTRPLGAEGLPIDWFAATRESDPPEAPGPRLAAVLADWCAATGGFDAVTQGAIDGEVRRASGASRRAAPPRPAGARPARRRGAAV